MALPTLVVVHGRDLRWRNDQTLGPAWEHALRSGLERARLPAWERIAIRFVDYGGTWRNLDQSDDIVPIQAQVATELLTRASGPGALVEGWAMWGGLDRLAAALDQQLGVNDRMSVELFLRDLAEYLQDDRHRSEANATVVAEVGRSTGEVILLGHGIGSIVSYVALHEEPESLAAVRGLVTFGSPLGLRAIRSRVEAIVPGSPFPGPPRRWINVSNADDFATTVPRLAPTFIAADGRQVEDEPAIESTPSRSGPGHGHDPLAYFGSSRFATRLRDLIGESDDATAQPGPAARPAPTPLPEETPAEVAEDEQATRAWPSPTVATPGAAPPWLDGIAPPWEPDDKDEEK